MALTHFSIRARQLDLGVALIEIAPKVEPLESAYVGVPAEEIAALRPRMAVGNANEPPVDDAAYSSTFALNNDPKPIACLLSKQNIAVGRAIYLKCAALPRTVVFGSEGSIRYVAAVDPDDLPKETFPSLSEWLQKTMPPPQPSEPPQSGTAYDLHPDAARAFDARANALVQRLSPDPLPDEPRRADSFPVPLHIPDNVEIEGPVHTECEVLDERGFTTIVDRDGRLTLFGPDYLEFRRLCEVIQRTPQYRHAVGVKFIKDHLFNWLIDVKKGRPASESYTAALSQAILPRVDRFEVWIPLHRVFVQTDFPVGAAVCRRMTPKFFLDPLNASLSRATSEDDRQHLTKYYDKLRQRHEAHAAMVVTVLAEESSAVELAKDTIRQSIDVLRLFDLP